MTDELNIKRLEVLAILANNPNGIEIAEFVDKGLRASAEYLYEKGYLEKNLVHQKLTLLRPNDALLTGCGYKITGKGDELIKNILEYVNDSLSIEI